MFTKSCEVYYKTQGEFFFFCLRKEKQVWADVAKIYRNNKNKSSLYDNMKKQTETCTSFAVTPQVV